MENIIGLTRGGKQWVPEFVIEVNQKTCIGCGRCYKVCPRQVFELIDRPEGLMDDMEEDDDDLDDDDDFDEEDGSDAKVMAIVGAMDCIGCTSCARVCPKKDCLIHAPRPVNG